MVIARTSMEGCHMEGRSVSLEKNSPGSARLDAIEGFSQQWAVALGRTGICTVSDVLAADPDTLAYMLDGYENAEQAIKLVKAHAKYLQTRLESRNETPYEPRHAGASIRPAAVSSQHKSTTSEAASHPADARKEKRMQTLSHTSNELNFAGVLGALAVSSVQEQKQQWLCRLDAMRLLVEHGGSEAQIGALLALDPFTPADESLRAKVEAEGGSYMKQLLEQCERVLAISIGPDGSVASGHSRRVAQAPGDARRVCAVLALARTDALGTYADDDAVDHERASVKQLYYRALADALHEAEPCPLTKRLFDHVRNGMRQARAA
ncbi:MAG: hypothetical protein KDA34_01870 [Phycisphaerales bacterium]|nr:hypothetical protein [Phycisphaerales bacterium]